MKKLMALAVLGIFLAAMGGNAFAGWVNGSMVITGKTGHMWLHITGAIPMGSNRTIMALQKAALTVSILMAGTMTGMESQIIWIAMMTMTAYPTTTTVTSMEGKSKICDVGAIHELPLLMLIKNI